MSYKKISVSCHIKIIANTDLEKLELGLRSLQIHISEQKGSTAKNLEAKGR